MTESKFESVVRRLEEGGISRETVGALIELVSQTINTSPEFLHDKKRHIISEQISELGEFVYRLSHQTSYLAWQMHEYLWHSSLGIHKEDAERPQLIPARIWIDDGDAVVIQEAFEEVVDSYGLTISVELPPERGSWFKRMFLRTQGNITETQLRDNLSDLEKMLEIQLGGRATSGLHDRQSEATARLLTALDNTSNAVVQIGNVLLIKNMGAVFARGLTPHELVYFERNAHLFRSPESALIALEMLSAASQDNTSSAAKEG
ncbi:hypothetical protein [Frankia sp. AgKG'84/4]|uniref:hypothetical protein n=1 Tax=Frankia sp. AgKG'84/4 TaxID=573490 RepID=UPI00200E8B7E|nr:hypothetical protein [Frankia sp. AgKG'84/4]MCL9794475.1 hypothetical protein [Frankia sp. AgKG'84/4]